MQHNESGDDKMAAIIEQIIEVENRGNAALIKIQQKRISQLKKIQKRQQEGKKIQAKRIVDNLKSSGILDKDGNLAFPYVEKD